MHTYIQYTYIIHAWSGHSFIRLVEWCQVFLGIIRYLCLCGRDLLRVLVRYVRMVPCGKLKTLARICVCVERLLFLVLLPDTIELYYCGAWHRWELFPGQCGGPQSCENIHTLLVMSVVQVVCEQTNYHKRNGIYQMQSDLFRGKFDWIERNSHWNRIDCPLLTKISIPI